MRIPSDDLHEFDHKAQMEEFNFGTHYICKATKEPSRTNR